MTSDSPAPVGSVAHQVAAYTERVNALIADFLAEQRTVVARISPHAEELVASISDLSRQGKRLRPRFAFLGFLAAGGDPAAESIVRVGASLELFQAAALIHDDLIDHSDTRRGAPSVHRRFEAIHREAGWSRDAARFGEAASVLAGDLSLSFSEQLFGTTTTPPAARAVFDAMRAQVMAGQFLDVLEESAGPTYGMDSAVDRARTIVRYKSAKYSTENPMLLGGTLAGASEPLLAQYSRFALPLGEAFQLRDDVLGVFGDPETTGKPSGDDLREGKRTELIAHALVMATPEAARFIDGRLGAADLTADEISRMCSILRDSGALAATEATINTLSDQGFSALVTLDVCPEIREALRDLGLAAIRRTT
ncbi:polyprenyl synthetase family protein [Zhihengliuella flava]|uniref:Geranylgeranyl diphosphate synthase type I n=1 Tax=Zhihengliuella flava TaxID=1285193 RepID=A0A931DDL5_9MICC|nr:polyprenyl synthetase family protein [Zhihengliuella flava]MBG6085621.1 geranylgeranyl diphosphate synthase type I [Zhihengliuella flava]